MIPSRRTPARPIPSSTFPMHKSPVRAGIQKTSSFLTCDAFGVLPPVSKLTPERAMYHFISGYTAKVAGTEMGITEPQASFSACFGAPFLVWHPGKYAEQLAKKMQQHNADVWLVNTGWSGGGYGVGKRITLTNTRSIIRAIHNGALADVPYENRSRALASAFPKPVPTSRAASCPRAPPGPTQPNTTPAPHTWLGYLRKISRNLKPASRIKSSAQGLCDTKYWNTSTRFQRRISAWLQIKQNFKPSENNRKDALQAELTLS